MVTVCCLQDEPNLKLLGTSSVLVLVQRFGQQTTDGDEQDGLKEIENSDEKLNCLKDELIENIANMLIFTSVSSAICDKHREEQIRKKSRFANLSQLYTISTS